MKVFFVFFLFIFSGEAMKKNFYGLESCAMSEAKVNIYARIETTNGDDYVKICEGSIFERYWVLTAASCIILDQDHLVLTRSHNPKVYNTKIYKPLEIRMHPKYNPNDDDHIQYNLALIKFQPDFNLTIQAFKGHTIANQDVLLTQKECQAKYGSQRKIIDKVETCISTNRKFATTRIGRYVVFSNFFNEDNYGILSEIGSCNRSYPIILANIWAQWYWIKKVIGTNLRFCG